MTFAFEFEHFNKISYFQYKKEDLISPASKKCTVETSFDKNLEIEILALFEKTKELKESEILERFGQYKQVKNKVKSLILEGKVMAYRKPKNNDSYTKMIRIVDPKKTAWMSINAQPCLTCDIVGECGLENPVSPARCDMFIDWLDSEISLDLHHNPT